MDSHVVIAQQEVALIDRLVGYGLPADDNVGCNYVIAENSPELLVLLSHSEHVRQMQILLVVTYVTAKREFPFTWT